MARKMTEFGRETMDRIAQLYGLAKPYAEAMGVDPFLVIGGPAEELDTINRLPFFIPRKPFFPSIGNAYLDTRVGGYPDWVGDWVKRFEYSHDDIKRDIADAKKVDQTHGVSNQDKLAHPILADLGYGNVKLGTAITLLQEYNKRYPDSDPLHLKQYNERYDDLARDLSMDAPLNATAKFAVLEAAEAKDFFERRAPKTWANADPVTQLGLVATYYNRGREKMHQVAAGAAERFGEYRPVPGYGGEKAAENGWALARAAGLELPFAPTSLGAGRKADRLSMPGYSGDGGRRRDNQDPDLYGNWGRDGDGRGIEPMRSRPEFERRSQLTPTTPGGLLASEFAGLAADASARPAEVASARGARRRSGGPTAVAQRKAIASGPWRYAATEPNDDRVPASVPHWQRPVSALDAYLMEREPDELDASPADSFDEARQGAAASRGQGGAVPTARNRSRSIVPPWQRPVSALDAYLMEPPPEEPDMPRTEIVAPVPVAAVRLAGGLLGDRFADLVRGATRRRSG